MIGFEDIIAIHELTRCSVAVLADTSVTSPRELLIYIMNKK